VVQSVHATIMVQWESYLLFLHDVRSTGHARGMAQAAHVAAV